MKKLNSNLHKAKKAKDDEFYTQLDDISKELKNYREHFKDKIVYCNCDDSEFSQFYTFFRLQFNFLGLKKLITTHYQKDGQSYKIEINRDDVIGNNYIESGIKIPLSGNGDFRSDECIELLKESDIVVTNPPFSLFREFVDLLIKHDKKFLIVGSMNAITYKETFKLIMNNQLWLGCNNLKEFVKPDGTIQKFGNINWYTNMTHYKRNEELYLFKKYNGSEYPVYDNYEAIEVSKTKEIPYNYTGIMGVPITFLEKYNPEQFEIVDINPHFFGVLEKGLPKPKQLKLSGKKDPYARILIRNKKPQTELL